MSPRSREFMDGARERIAGAGRALAAGDLAIAASAAYYAMLYAARAALSERDLHAKTHSGTWTLFQQALVQQGDFDLELSRQVTAAQEIREQGDYEAKTPSTDQARALLETAERFVSEIEHMLGD